MSLLDFLIAPAQAQSAGAGAQPSPWQFPIMMIGFFALMYFFMIRPQMKRAKEQKDMLSKLSRGDEVITTGGIVGRVEEVGDSFVTVEIANNVQIKLQKGAINAVLPKGTLKSI